MTVFAAIRSRRRSVTVLSVALLSWFGLLTTACAAAIVSQMSSTDVFTSITVNGQHHSSADVAPHGHHHGSKQAEQGPEADCCCNLTAVFGAESSDLAKFAVLVALPPRTEPVLPISVIEVLKDRQRPPPHETSPPVYLATQRLRI